MKLLLFLMVSSNVCINQRTQTFSQINDKYISIIMIPSSLKDSSDSIGWRYKIANIFTKYQKLYISSNKTWVPHITRRENNNIISILTFQENINKWFGRKLGKAVTVTGLIFWKIDLRKTFFNQFQSTGTLTVCSMKVKSFLYGNG